MVQGLKALAATYLGVTHHLNSQGDEAFEFFRDVSELGCMGLME